MGEWNYGYVSLLQGACAPMNTVYRRPMCGRVAPLAGHRAQDAAASAGWLPAPPKTPHTQ